MSLTDATRQLYKRILTNTNRLEQPDTMQTTAVCLRMYEDDVLNRSADLSPNSYTPAYAEESASMEGNQTSYCLGFAPVPPTATLPTPRDLNRSVGDRLGNQTTNASST